MSEATVAGNEAAVKSDTSAGDQMTIARRALAATALPDFVILHRGCRCYNSGWLLDAVDAETSCRICDDLFGFNVPIVRDEGRLTVHLSCQIAADARRAATPRALSSDDYDDIAGQLHAIAKDDARIVHFVSGLNFYAHALSAINEAIRREKAERAACSKTLSVNYFTDLARQDVERLAWRYLGALSMAKEKEVRS